MLDAVLPLAGGALKPALLFALFLALEVLTRVAVTRPAERCIAAQRALARDAKALRAAALALPQPLPSAQSAALARQAAAKENEAEHLRAAAAARRSRVPFLLKAGLQLGAVALLRGAPVLRAPGPPLGWPLDGLLAWRGSGGAVPGAVGALPFALLCGRVASLIARILLR